MRIEFDMERKLGEEKEFNIGIEFSIEKEFDFRIELN